MSTIKCNVSDSDVKIINKSSSSPKMSIMYVNGVSVSIMGSVSEFNVQRRKGWIERRLRKSGDYSLDNIVDCIKMSRFWLNYVSMGTRYPNIVDKKTYLEWDKDRRNNVIPPPKSSKQNSHKKRKK